MVFITAGVSICSTSAMLRVFLVKESVYNNPSTFHYVSCVSLAKRFICSYVGENCCVCVCVCVSGGCGLCVILHYLSIISYNYSCSKLPLSLFSPKKTIKKSAKSHTSYACFSVLLRPLSAQSGVTVAVILQRLGLPEIWICCRNCDIDPSLLGYDSL